MNAHAKQRASNVYAKEGKGKRVVYAVVLKLSKVSLHTNKVLYGGKKKKIYVVLKQSGNRAA